MIRADFALRRAGQLVTMSPRPDDPLGMIRDGAVAAFSGRVVWVGPDRDLERSVHLDGDLVDGAGQCVLPGLVDAHTHPVFAGSRADEFAERLSGVSYATQQRSQGGIRQTVAATRAADEEELVALAAARATRFLRHGTTTIEAKTGYGLDLAGEAKSLRVLDRLKALTPLRIAPTLLAAHVVPDGIERAAYIRMLTEEMLPAFRRQAIFCDAWCDEPAFTGSETRQVLQRAKELGYRLRVHAAQLAPGSGPDIAAELGAASADHLEYATQAQARALARSGTVAVLCPTAAFTVPGTPRPPIESLRAAGVPIALASDLNPGTANSESLTFGMSLACALWGLAPRDAIAAGTVSAARSLGLQGVAGCLKLQSFADLGVYDVEQPDEITYHVGVNRAVITVVGGRVWTAP